MIKVTDEFINGNLPILESVMADLARNNTAFPQIKRVVYNLKTSESKAVRDADGKLVLDPATGKPKRETVQVKPVLTTTVFFVDGTKCSVSNSSNDDLTLTPDGYASDACKESGLAYCIAKRLFGKLAPNGEVLGDGFGRKLSDLVASSYDCQKEEKLRKAAAEASKAAHLATLNTAKPKPKYSLKETLERVNVILDAWEKNHPVA